MEIYVWIVLALIAISFVPLLIRGILSIVLLAIFPIRIIYNIILAYEEHKYG